MNNIYYKDYSINRYGISSFLRYFRPTWPEVTGQELFDLNNIVALWLSINKVNHMIVTVLDMVYKQE
ncbi:hypothetical protein [Brevibacillus brevis]|uniref:hypothetical protein n=1 Tax=Brevibacillus brevis TaxID=1393 RepID=UPI0037C9ED2B